MFKFWKKETHYEILHDALCTKNPCICVELSELRSERHFQQQCKDKLLRTELARKALDAQ